MKTPEFRVRPVVRYVVTRYSPPDNGNSSLETLGECNNEQYAEIVAEALRSRVAPREYVLVQETVGKIQAQVYYAYSEAEVERQLAELGTRHAYRVYSRERDMTLPA